MSLRKKRILLLLLSTLLLLGLSTRLKPIDRELWHADLLEQMEKTDDFSEFCDLLFRYGVTADSITTAYTLRDPSAYGIPALPPRLLETGSGRKSAKKQASVTRSTASLLLNKMCELKVPEGELFVMGDHRGTSVDSRSRIFGTVPAASVVARPKLVAWLVYGIAWLGN